MTEDQRTAAIRNAGAVRLGRHALKRSVQSPPNHAERYAVLADLFDGEPDPCIVSATLDTVLRWPFTSTRGGTHFAARIAREVSNDLDGPLLWLGTRVGELSERQRQAVARRLRVAAPPNQKGPR